MTTCSYICGQHLKRCVLPKYHEQKWCECEVRLCHQKEDMNRERVTRKCVLCGAITDSFQDQACRDCQSDHDVKLRLMKMLVRDIFGYKDNLGLSYPETYQLADYLIRKGWRNLT